MHIADMNWMQVETCLDHDARLVLGDGNFGGAWQKPDEVMLEAWNIGVEETRSILESPWPVHVA